MSEYLQTTVDKFTFRVDTTCSYTPEGLWVRVEGSRVKLGLSDYLQQRSGDMAFVEVPAAGTQLARGDELAAVETIKVDTQLVSPVSGVIRLVNPALEESPEVINQDPYQKGWLCEMEASDWENDRQLLMDAQAYFVQMKQEAEEEAKKL